ncbi:type 1 glutamine amidotransferase domain-containing protein [Marinomonas ostreistagni]|uniref:type 1 glutamine amidotransferase domain-containing protein n=1 Tax=Marinomonas ostreistagni TaxID=359209 RepID=UPI0019507230|nr:type 1 glutamine amidotransferase domain-containing protein [Marinomonas ostreistagni]MBM6550572.1 type 1 glutamine amidotransferase domain-containing protein [Marinomonas ostreistagni]
MNILMVLTSHDQLGDTGNKTGFWLEEFASPYYTFLDAGANITLATPKGGQAPLDPNSDTEDAQTEYTERYKDDPDAQQALANTVKLGTVKADDYDAVFYPGGHGPLWDLAESDDSAELIAEFDRQQKDIGLVCHAPAVLRKVRNINGDLWVKGRKLTGFSNSEEEGVGLTNVVPFLLEDELKRLGAEYEKGEDWESYVVEESNLITGQNPASSQGVAQIIVNHLS